MQRHLFLSILAAILCFPLMAQDFSLGVRGGATVGAPIPDKIDREVSDGKMGLGPVAGLYMSYGIGDKFNFHADLLYVHKSAEYFQLLTNDTVVEQQVLGMTHYLPTYYEAEATGSTSFNYLELPLQFSFELSPTFLLKAGGYVSYLMGGTDSGEAIITIGDGTLLPQDTMTFNNKNDLRRYETGINFGATYQMPLGVDLDFRVSRSLGNLYEKGFLESYGAPYEKVFHTYFQFTAGYRFIQ